MMHDLPRTCCLLILYVFENSRLKEWGFEKGWGDNAGRVRETMRLASEILQAPDPINMESFFSRLPTTFKIVIFSIHGYFGQANVLGLPDTGGQVYIHSNSYPFLLSTFSNTCIVEMIFVFNRLFIFWIK